MSTTFTIDKEKQKRSDEEEAQRRGFSSVEEMNSSDTAAAAERGGYASVGEYETSRDKYRETMELQRKKERSEDLSVLPAERERLKGEVETEELRIEREKAESVGLKNPILRKRKEELERRTSQDLISPDRAEAWERSAREGASSQKQAVLARGRAMGLNAAQMEALNQGLQETDIEFEKQIQQLRYENRETAKQELENFTLGLQEKGSNYLLNQESLALQKEQAAAANSKALWGSILGFVGGVIGATAGFIGGGFNPGTAALGASLLGGAGKAVGEGIGGSDERIKSNIDRTKTKNAAYDFLDNLDVAQYNMPGANTPEMGVMAQSMEKSSLGQQAVTEVEGIKDVNMPQAFKSLIVAQKEMHDRIKELEKR